MAALEELKVKRANEKRKVTNTHNSIIAQTAEGFDIELENQLRSWPPSTTGSSLPTTPTRPGSRLRGRLRRATPSTLTT